MGELLVKLLNMSIAASWLILAVCLLRVLMKKAPRWIVCALWGLVAIRLICPVAIESEVSLIPSIQPIRMEQAQPVVMPGGMSGNGTFTDTADGQQAAHSTTYQGQSGNTLSPSDVPDGGIQRTFTGWDAAGIVWLTGAGVILAIALIHFIKLKRSLREAVPLRENIWICDAVTSPFILGIGKPRIYLSSSMDETQMESVIAHENAHIRRLDPLWKLLGYLLLAVYWFNPLSWLAYHFLCKDIELACDEKVVRTLPLQKRQEYCQALLACSTQKHMRLSYPLAFGEVGVKDRVKNVLHYRKPQLWVILAAVVVCAVVCVCFLTNPKVQTEESTEGHSTEEQSTEAYGILEAKPAIVTEETLPGADGASLDFVSGSRVIFHDYYGLFVYDFEKRQMVASLDLASIGCDKTQGDEACEVMVDETGEEIFLHVMSSPDMYVFSPNKGTLEERLYSMEGISVFGGFVDTMEYLQPDYTIFRTAYAGLLTDKDGAFYVAVLESGSGLPVDMAVAFYEWEGDGTLSGSSSDDCRMIFREDDSEAVQREYEAAKQAITEQEENIAQLEENYVGGPDWSAFQLYDQECENGTHIYLSTVSDSEGYLLYCSSPAAGLMEKYVYYSKDGGASFDLVCNLSNEIENYPIGFAFCTEAKGLIITQNHGSEIYAYMTEDGGITWKPYELDVPDASLYYYIDGVSLKKADDSENAWELVLAGVLDDRQEFHYISSDNWETWKLQ